jgi:hypothetical protein
MSEVSTLLRQGLDRDGPLVAPGTAPTAVEFHQATSYGYVGQGEFTLTVRPKE